MKKTSWFAKLLGQEQKTPSAHLAKDRLTVLIASDNNQLKRRLTQDCIDKMKREIADVVGRYVSGVMIEDIDINHHKEDMMDVLQMSINLPDVK